MNIIELANDSGLVYYGMGKDRARFIHHLEKFAALVEAAARADEREACAKLCDEQVSELYASRDTVDCAEYLAGQIRARGAT
jgi:hypothetical protein